VPDKRNIWRNLRLCRDAICTVLLRTAWHPCKAQFSGSRVPEMASRRLACRAQASAVQGKENSPNHDRLREMGAPSRFSLCSPCIVLTKVTFEDAVAIRQFALCYYDEN
jgi:hypothetical protein